MTKEEFKSFLITDKFDDSQLINIVRKLIIHGVPYVFMGDDNKYFDFRNRISSHFSVGYYEVYIVGSAKLGFSYLGNKQFDLNSDIDVAIVNENLFDYYLTCVGEFQYKLDYSQAFLDKSEYINYINFLKYLTKGWMRPDLLPISFGMQAIKSDWFEFFKSLSYGKSEVGNYKVNAGIYKNYSYLERYHLEGIKTYLDILNRERESKNHE